MKLKYIAAASVFFACSFNILANTAKIPDKYTVQIGSFKKDYPVTSPKGNDKVKIVYVSDLADNIRLAKQVVMELVRQLKTAKLLDSIDAIVIPGDKANMLGTLLFEEIQRNSPSQKNLEFCIIRSAEKATPLYSVDYASITGGEKKLHIREDQADRIKDKRVLIFDDVIATGGTLKAAKSLVEKSGATVVAYACAAVEGEVRKDFETKPLIHVFNLPIFQNVQ